MGNEETKTLRVAVADLEVDVRRLKKVIRRAAEALEKWNIRNRFSDLIAELRKAAQ
jgi:hypothetical protein